jgi:hypothetical protein
MLPRMAFGLGMAFGLALAGPGLAVVGGQPSAQQSQQLGSQEERINRRQARNAKTAIRPSEPNSFVGWSRTTPT